MNLEARMVVEALRAGVPSRAVVRLLGTEETAIEQRFEATLRDVWSDPPRLQSAGMGIAGGFGTGKSHLLGYLAEVALGQNFAVSRVVVSKETPLADPARVFQAAIRETRLPDRNDDPMTVVLAALRDRSHDLAALEAEVGRRDSGLAQVFAAIVFLLGKPATPADRVRRFERFLAGGKLNQGDLRQALKEAGASGLFDLRAVNAADLAVQRARFVPLLFRAAGYAGWCLLIDEVELIGRYTPLQRALAYAELARWVGLDAGVRVPGLVTVYAITDDFAGAVITPKRDDEKLPERLLLKGRPEQAERARRGIRHIQGTLHTLRRPGADDLAACHDKLRGLYGLAYGWPAPALTVAPPTASRTMRQHIKSWVTQWDLLRLQGAVGAIVTGTLGVSYAEMPALTEAREDEGDG
jgi:hypothetical protein